MVGNAHPTMMSNYRRYFVPGGTYFFTIVTRHRHPIFSNDANVQRLREAIAEVKLDMPFEINAAVVLPDHMHLMWTLPRGDADYSKRIGRIKVTFTKRLRETGDRLALSESTSASRRKHRESDVWQRRFWEHAIVDEDEFEAYFNYVHFNPVKHRYVACPHLWTASSFHRWVKLGIYEVTWGCQCKGRVPHKLDFSTMEEKTGEPA